MDKSEFGQLFDRAVNAAIDEARQQDGRIGAEPCWVEFHGCGLSGERIDAVRALDLLKGHDEKYPFIVDVAVVAVSPDGRPIVFMRPSGHPRVPYLQTWAPDQLGPFRILQSASIELRLS